MYCSTADATSPLSTFATEVWSSRSGSFWVLKRGGWGRTVGGGAWLRYEWFGGIKDHTWVGPQLRQLVLTEYLVVMWQVMLGKSTTWLKCWNIGLYELGVINAAFPQTFIDIATVLTNARSCPKKRKGVHPEPIRNLFETSNRTVEHPKENQKCNKRSGCNLE